MQLFNTELTEFLVTPFENPNSLIGLSRQQQPSILKLHFEVSHCPFVVVVVAGVMSDFFTIRNCPQVEEASNVSLYCSAPIQADAGHLCLHTMCTET